MGSHGHPRRRQKDLEVEHKISLSRFFNTSAPKLSAMLSIALYVYAMTQNSVELNGVKEHGWSESYAILMFGWFATFTFHFSWWANPVLFFAWFFAFKGKIKSALQYGCTAVALMSLFLLYEEMPAMVNGWGNATITGYGIGYWLWLLSGISLALPLALQKIWK